MKKNGDHRPYIKLTELEKKLLSSALASKENASIIAQCQMGFMHTDAGKDVLCAIKEVHEDGACPTATTIYHVISDATQNYLMELVELNVNSYEFDSLLKQYQSARRNVIILPELEDCIAAYKNDDRDAEEKFMKCYNLFNATYDVENIVTMQDLCKIPVKDLPEKMQTDPFGIPSLDEFVYGTRKGMFCIFAGRPGSGKTSAGLQSAKSKSLRMPVLFFSLEMPSEELYVKILSSESRIDSRKIERGLDDKETAIVGHAKDKMNKLSNLIIYDGPITETKLLTTIRKLKYQKDIGAVYIDYAQLVTGMTGDTQNEKYENFSRSLKLTARELKIPVVAFSQLTKDVLKEDRAPTLGDLRGSGAFGQDADLVALFYGEKISKEMSAVVPACTIAKNRQGPEGKVEGFKYNKPIHLMS